MQTIEENDCYRECREKCVQELERMKVTKFYNNVSIYRVLMGPKKGISCYARNEELLRALEANNYENEFPICFVWLKKGFDAEVEKQKLRYTAAEILSNLFKFNDPLHPAIQNVMDYLQDEDVELLTI